MRCRRVRAARRTRELQEAFVAQTSRLEALVHEDPLTRPLNRRSILTRLEGVIPGARRHHRSISVAMVDLDHSEALNDRYGHQAGDSALTVVHRADAALYEAKVDGGDAVRGSAEGPAATLPGRR